MFHFFMSSRFIFGGSLVRRSEEHTSELQSQSNIVCRLLLEKKNVTNTVRARRGLETDVANSIPVKAHPIGTLTETPETIPPAPGPAHSTGISHLTAETEDNV